MCFARKRSRTYAAFSWCNCLLRFTVSSPMRNRRSAELQFRCCAAKIAYVGEETASQYDFISAISLLHASMKILMAETKSTVNRNEWLQKNVISLFSKGVLCGNIM